MYMERYSDLVMDRWAEFWSVGGVAKEEDEEEEDSDEDMGRDEENREESTEEAPSKATSPLSPTTTRPEPIKHRTQTDRRGRTTIELRLTHSLSSTTSTPPHSWQWRQLLFSQPPIRNLELVQQISRRVGSTLEFRSTIHRPNGLTMGFLYDAVRYWHEVEGSPVQLLFGNSRKAGDLVDEWIYYPDGQGLKWDGVGEEERDCVTIWGKTSVGCGQYGGLTYASWGPTREGQVRRERRRYIRSGDEHVGFEMGEPREVRYDLSFLVAAREEELKRGEEEEDGG